MISHVLLWSAFWTQWVVLVANILLLRRIARGNKEGREQLKAVERDNEVWSNVVALYLAFHFKGLYW